MHKRVFFDTSVIIAALLSRSGASYCILSELSDDFEFVINEYVFEEVRRSIERKFKKEPGLLSNLFSVIALSGMVTLRNPDKKEVRDAEQLISKKDASILASALIESDYLLTLDNEFFKPSIVAAAHKRHLLILKPGDFIHLFDR